MQPLDQSVRNDSKEAVLDGRIALQAVMQITHEPPTKRVVPRSMYMRIQALKASLHVSSFLYGIMAALCCALVLYFLYSLVTSLLFNPGVISWEGVGIVALSCLLGISVAVVEIRNCRETGAERREQAKRIALVAPLTRANTAHLPARESLVRPSSEAERETKDMLRPASIHEAIPEAHMLRPVAAQPNALPVTQLVHPAPNPNNFSEQTVSLGKELP